MEDPIFEDETFTDAQLGAVFRALVAMLDHSSDSLRIWTKDSGGAYLIAMELKGIPEPIQITAASLSEALEAAAKKLTQAIRTQERKSAERLSILEKVATG